jgi:hypothetical protein
MLEAVKKINLKMRESQRAVDIARLYHIAAQLTIATSTKEPRSGYSSSKDQQDLFANHFVFLVDHAIDLIDLELQGQ